MSLWNQYILARTVQEAQQALVSAPGPARAVAGGTDLLLEMQQGRHSPLHTLVDISAIPELKQLELRPDSLFIGAGVPVSVIATSPLVQRHAQAVAEACGLIGGPQVRNTATLGGNVAHALPAADGAIGLVALDAWVEIAGPGGWREVPILSIYKGVGVSTLGDADILLGFHLPLGQGGQASAFSRVMRPQGVALPILNMAVWLERQDDRLLAIRISVGPAGPTPQRALAIEEFLTGKEFTPETSRQAQALVDSSLRFRTSPARATSAYRYHLCKILLNQVLHTAWQRSLEV